MSFIRRASQGSAALALSAALSACQSSASVAPVQPPDTAPAIIKGRFDLGAAHGYRTQQHEGIIQGFRLFSKPMPNGIPVGTIRLANSPGLKRDGDEDLPSGPLVGYELLAEGEKTAIDELVVQPDGSWQVEVPAGPVTLKLLLADGTMLPVIFPSGAGASHWMNTVNGNSYDLGLLTTSGENKGAAQHNPLMSLDTDGDGVFDPLDLDGDGKLDLFAELI